MAVTITPGSTSGDLNGATDVVAVAAPAANTTRTVISLRVFNVDTAAVTVTLTKDISGTEKSLEKVTALAADATWSPIDRDRPVILSATTHSLELFMSGAPATTNPYFEVAWIDRLVS